MYKKGVKMKTWLKGGLIALFVFVFFKLIDFGYYWLSLSEWNFNSLLSYAFDYRGDFIEWNFLASNFIPLISFFIFGALLIYIYNANWKPWIKGGILLLGIIHFIILFDIVHYLDKLFWLLSFLIIKINTLIWFPYDSFSKHSVSSISKGILVVIYLILIFVIGAYLGNRLTKPKEKKIR